MATQRRSGKKRKRYFKKAIQPEEECRKKLRIACCIGTTHAMGINIILTISWSCSAGMPAVWPMNVNKLIKLIEDNIVFPFYF